MKHDTMTPEQRSARIVQLRATMASIPPRLIADSASFARIWRDAKRELNQLLAEVTR